MVYQTPFTADALLTPLGVQQAETAHNKWLNEVGPVEVLNLRYEILLPYRHPQEFRFPPSFIPVLSLELCARSKLPGRISQSVTNPSLAPRI